MNLAQAIARLQPATPAAPFPDLAWAWPTGGRDLLLRAATLPDLVRAAAAYQEWQDRFDFEEVDFARQRLLVGISNRIPEGLLAAKERARLNGIERMLWSHCIVSLRKTEPALAALETAGIEVMILKGAVRSVLDISNLRGRYASELDMLVRPEDFRRAWDALIGAGWNHYTGEEPRFDRLIGANLFNGRFGELDLHKYPHHQVVTGDARPDALWARASRHVFFGHQVLLPSPTDRLLMAITHGGIGGHEQSDWMVDCVLLVHSGEIDWPLFETLAAERAVEASAAIVLSYLRGPLEVPVPADVLDRLSTRARRHPLRLASALLQARPKREHSLPSALARGVARGIRMVRKPLAIRRAEALRVADTR